MKIGELAKATVTQVETIRYYEREGLLPSPGRTASNYRAYDEAHVQRLAFIRHCRCLDMSLDEIRVLLAHKERPQDACGQVDQLLDDHIGHVVHRIRELRALEKELRALKASCGANAAIQDCRILQGLERAAREHGHHGSTGAHGEGVHARPAARRKVKPVNPQGVRTAR